MLPTMRDSGLRAGAVPIPSNAVSSRRTVRPGVVSGRPRVSAGPAPAHRADLAQSRLFAALLLDEIADLEDQMTLAERRSRRVQAATGSAAELFEARSSFPPVVLAAAASSAVTVKSDSFSENDRRKASPQARPASAQPSFARYGAAASRPAARTAGS